MATGKIGVTTENIFPVIKKFLYSDHEIFLRELVSNAIDASQKLRTLATFGDFKGELGKLQVEVKVDKEAGTLTVSDRGIGMDSADIDRYINQIAFSGAEEFLAKYKDTANSIIGHFGLGFYSAFMVSKKVVIRSLSYKEGVKGVEWSCDGSPEYEMKEIEKSDRGTDVILYIDDDSKEFLENERIVALLKKYCRFLPLPVVCGKEQEWKDGKMTDTDRDLVVNATEPLWTRKPSDLTDEDYLRFYRELMPGQEDPMFWIHLNVDYPFTLTGILYFPKVKNEIELQRNRIQLYCNQVYVTDQVEGVVPEFMTLMQGVIDSPDIPLNVSRSYLQADSQVKKISSYISKKVAEKLDKMFAADRKGFEEKWDSISIFIIYGMLTDEKFYEAAKKFFLFKTTDGKYYTLDEYRALVEAEQTDREGSVVYLYSTDPAAQYSYIEGARDKGYSVLEMTGQLDNHLLAMFESKLEKTRFVRVDSDIPERLIPKEDLKNAGLDALQLDIATNLFRSALPAVGDSQFVVSFEAVSAAAAPATVTQNEYMRRMKDMAAMQPGAGAFFASMPDSYSLVVNTDQAVVKEEIDKAVAALTDKVKPGLDSIAELDSKLGETRSRISDKEIQADEKKRLEDEAADIEKKIADTRAENEKAVAEYAASAPRVGQIIDLALLRANLLKGEAMKAFISRSIELL
ncbi:MAG: molecular chaperone HtpG [Muribaculaceae bacterium]|nr:molecular chaperone HtpG [Muribaculaceae bacterium]